MKIQHVKFYEKQAYSIKNTFERTSDPVKEVKEVFLRKKS